jgi:glycosyltransferase involved in cell wall biosynthesis
MNICIVSDIVYPFRGGLERVLLRQAEEITKMRHKVIILTSAEKNRSDVEIINSIKIYRLPSINIPFGFRVAIPKKKNIKKILLKEKIDLVHCHTPFILGYQSLKIARSLKKPYILTLNAHPPKHYTIHSRICNNRYFNRYILKLIIRFCNNVDQIIVPSYELKNYLLKNKVITNIEVISNPIDLRQFNKSNFNKQFIKKYNLENQRIILTIGRLMKDKNQKVIIEALPLIKKKIPNIKLIIIGEGYLKSKLIKLIKKRDCRKEVLFFNKIPNSKISRAFFSCNIFILPSFFEAQPLTLLEAMACGKPVIVSNEIISASELVKDGINGFLFNPNSEKELAENIINLLNNEKLQNKMGKESLKIFKNIGIESSFKKLETLYKKLII